MNLTKKNIQKTSGIHRLGKFYKPGQLVTIDRHVYRITKTYVDCSMCNLYLSQQREWCKYCINGFYCKLVKKHKG